MRKVLIIACGARKVETGGQRMRALDLYAGRQFRLARQLERMGWVVLILSAEHGLIQAAQPIATYDRRMDAARAEELAGTALQGSKFGVSVGRHDRCVVYGGALYRGVVAAWAAKRGVTLEPITGRGIGEHYSKLAELVRNEAGAGLLGRAA